MPISPRARRWLPILAVAIALIAVATWWVDRQLEPQRLTALVLDQAGRKLGLQLGFSGEPDYALKPEPRLLIPLFTVRGPDGKLFLSAQRAEISLPWSTIKGDAPVITRIELERPVLDVAGLQRWLATRPEEPFELPTFSRGIVVVDGTIQGDGFRISALHASLPQLKTGDATELKARGRFERGDTRLDFDSTTALATPGLRSAYSLNASGVLQRQPQALKFALDSTGSYDFGDAATTLVLDSLAVSGDAPIPGITGKGKLVVAQRLGMDLDAVLSKWPREWPALPEPLASEGGGLPLKLSYLGEKDLSGPVSLHVERRDTLLDAEMRVREVLDWIDGPPGSPLSPVFGTFRTPKLVFDGVELEGVEVEVVRDVVGEPGAAAESSAGADSDAAARLAARAKSTVAEKPAAASKQAPGGVR
jgi:hypothetical protein